MDFDLIVRNARLFDAERNAPLVDIGVRDGRYAAIAPGLDGAAGEQLDVAGGVVSPGFVETHIHLDKTCILDRCACAAGRSLPRAMERISAVKHTFSVEDVVVVDATDAVDGLREIAPTLMGYKRGRRTYVRERARLLRPALERSDSP